MATKPRFWTGNHIFNGAGMVESSQEVGLPVERLADQMRTDKWRTLPGWTITDHNNRIDFNRGGVKVATIANGYYPTGALAAAAVVSALNAADPPGVGLTWACDYNVASADTFRIRNTSGAPVNFSLLFSTGANAYRSVHRSLGFASTDVSGGTTYTATQVSYQSQHFIVITLTAAQLAEGVTGLCALDHNFLGINVGNFFRIQSNSTNDWSAPTTHASSFGSTALTPPNPNGRVYISNPGHTYWRVAIDDVCNPIGYFELGILGLWNYVTSPYCFSVDQARKPRDFGSVMTAIGGHHSAAFRRRRKEMSLGVEDVLDATAETTLRTFFGGISTGENFILDFDPDIAASEPWTRFLYGFIPDTESEGFVPYNYWAFRFPFCEAL